MASEELIDHLQGRLSPAAARALTLCEELCREGGFALFLVGGALRDLLQGRDHVDLDLALEGEAAPIATALAAALNGRAVLHRRFGTAAVSGSGFHLDLAATRREHYTLPGALPTVERADLRQDLARRDFSLNALALRLTDPAGELVDLFGGRADLEAGLVRVLHETSFQDDATRTLRAVRYAARLGFRLEETTETWLRRDLSFLDAISGPRLRRELSLLLEEESAVTGAALAAYLGILEAIHLRLRFHAESADAWRAALAGPRLAPRDELGFCLLSDARDEADVASLVERLHLRGRIERALSDLVRLHGLSAKLTRPAAPSAAVELLDGKAAAAVWALAVLDQNGAGETCRMYLETWRRIHPSLAGADLLALGYEPGAGLGEALRALRRARLDGEASTRVEEVAYLRERRSGR